MVDGVSGPFHVATRFEKLRSLQRSWNGMQEPASTVLNLDQHIPIYDLQKGILSIAMWESSSIQFYRLPSRVNEIEEQTWSIPEDGVRTRDFTTDPANDMIVILEDLAHS